MKSASSSAWTAACSAASAAAAATPANSTGCTPMAVDKLGNVYTGEVDNAKRIQKFKLTSDALR